MKRIMPNAAQARAAVIALLMALSTVIVEAQTANDSTVRQPTINFYGTGNIQKSLGNGEQIPASTGIGVNYQQWYPETGLLYNIINKLEVDALINVASNVDTVVATYDGSNRITNASSFGNSILTPLASGQAVKIGLKLNFNRDFLGETISGVKVRYTGANRNWQETDSTAAIQSTASAFRIGVFHEFLKPDLLLNDLSINFGVYLAYNSIKGDLSMESNKNFMKQILNTNRNTFIGPEVELEIRLKNLRAQFAYSWLQPGSDVPGLTDGRLITTISFVGGFGLKLDRD